MTTIQCNFKNSISQNLDGYILVGLDSWLMKDGETSSYTPKVGRVEFVAGSATLELAPSELEKVTYTFEVWYYDEVTTSDPETGEPVITVTELLLVPKFYAMVPDSDDPILFNDLAKQSGINRDNIDTAISAITRRLYNEDVFWTRLQENLFVAKGYYDPVAWYSRGDVITWDGGSYLYYFSERTQGVLPSTTTHWQKLADRGATGTGTTGNDTPFDAGWNGQTDAPSRNAIYDALQNYALTSTVSGLAPLNSPVLTGTPTRTSSILLTNRSTEIPTTNWVQTLLDEVRKAVTPIGTVVNYAGLSAPIGWVLCDGRVLSQATYSALYAILGANYNTGGEAVGEFRVPDLRGRFILTPDAMGGVAANRSPGTTVASSGGTSTVTLTSAQMPVHRHNFSVRGFTASGIAEAAGSGYGAISFGNIAPSAGVTDIAGNRFAGSDALGALRDTGGTAGITQSHNNQPPYLTMNAIIYTGV